MRLIFATIVAAATLTTLATPALADGERGRGGWGENRTIGQDGERGRDRDRSNHNYNNNYNRAPSDHHNRERDYRFDHRRPSVHYDNRGSRYWGPSSRQWSRWDNNWGDPHRFARQWGFDRYDQHRGWQRGQTWYAYPSQWSDWGGWNWSFSWGSSPSYASNGYITGNGYNNYAQNQCVTYRTEDWINGRRAQITYLGCTDTYGRIIEQPNTRQFERWVW